MKAHGVQHVALSLLRKEQAKVSLHTFTCNSTKLTSALTYYKGTSCAESPFIRHAVTRLYHVYSNGYKPATYAATSYMHIIIHIHIYIYTYTVDAE